jgi:Uncharacterized protein conserved in bacteria
MGGACVAVKAFLEDLGADVVAPPFCSSKTLEIGTKYSPETACLPLKVNIGNYIQSIEMGADTVIITGSCGPCRFGYYGIVEEEILKSLGYDVDVIVFDPPGEDIREFARRAGRVANGKPLPAAVKALYKGYLVSRGLDEMDRMAFYLRPREKNKGTVKRIYNEYLIKVNKTNGTDNALKLINETRNKLKNVEINQDSRPLRIGIIGEIYTVIEPFVNLYIEEKLGNLGVEVDRSMTVSGWVKSNIFSKLAGLNSEKLVEKAAEPYLKTMVGGHAQQCIGNAVLYARRGFDGLIQLLPFSCMPEIVASSILPGLSKKENIPCMTLVLDELTGESGYMTRLEAFVDMLEIKREAENH